MAARNPSSNVRSTSDFDVQAALGRLISDERTPLRTISKFGFNPAVGTGEEGIWAQGGDFNWLVAPDFVRIAAGGDANDSLNGDGARTISIEGIGENLKITREIIETNGASASNQSENKFWRVWRVRVESVGTYDEANTDDIVLETVGNSTILAKVIASTGTSNLGFFSTPDDHFALVRHILVGVEGLKLLNLRMYRRDNFTVVAAPCESTNAVRQFISLEGFHTDTLKSLLVMPPLTDISFRGSAAVAPIAASVAFDVLLMPIK